MGVSPTFRETSDAHYGEAEDLVKMADIALDRAYLMALWLETYLFGMSMRGPLLPSHSLVARCLFCYLHYVHVYSPRQAFRKSLLGLDSPDHCLFHFIYVSYYKMFRSRIATN